MLPAEPHQIYLESSELGDWEKHCANYKRRKPNAANKYDVDLFRAKMKYLRLVEKDDDSIKAIPAGDFVVVHLTNGVLCHGSWDGIDGRDGVDEYVFQHKPQPEHRLICKCARYNVVNL